MRKYEVGEKVFIVGSSYATTEHTKKLVGDFGFIKYERDNDGQTAIYDSDNYDSFFYNDEDFIPYSEAAVTVNGVEYIRKDLPHKFEEPKREHVWKFGDWVRNRHSGEIAMVVDWEPISSTATVVYKKPRSLPVLTNVSELIYISSAEIPE